MSVPTTMRAGVLRGKGEVEVTSVPVPEPAPGEILMAVDHCGVCGTDLHMVLEGWGQPGGIGGHELSGRVVALGDGVNGFSLGDRVVGGVIECGVCVHCKAGRPSLCRQSSMLTGADTMTGFAEFTRLVASGTYLIPPTVDQRAAALTEPLAVAMHGITRSGARPGMRVLVTGVGPIGALAVAALRAMGVADITVSEPSPLRRERAALIGATTVVAPEELETPHRYPTRHVSQPYDVVLECSGNATAFEVGLGSLAPGGTIVLVGTGVKPLKLDFNRTQLNELTITASFNYDPNGFPAALDLLASGRLPIEHLVEPDDVTLEGLVPALRSLASGQTTRKVLISPKEL